MLKSGPILKRINLIIIFLFLLILILISYNIWAYMEFKAFFKLFEILPSEGLPSGEEILSAKVSDLNIRVNAITIVLIFNIIIFIYTLILHKKWIKIRMGEIEKYSISEKLS